MASATKEFSRPLNVGIPTLRINTDISNARQVPFEQINSAPVTKRELAFPEFGYGYQRSKEAFASDDWRRTMAATSSADNSESMSERASLGNGFSTDPEMQTPESIYEADKMLTGFSHCDNKDGGHSLIDVMSSSMDSSATPSPSPVERRPALARLVSHGYSSSGRLSGHTSFSPHDKFDVFELLPVALDSKGDAVCQNHNYRAESCACEAFPLVEIGTPMGASNRVCYPIEEVDESQLLEHQPSYVQHVPKRQGTPADAPQPQIQPAQGDTLSEAERFMGLLGKLRKSAEDKCEKLINEWKDPVTGCSEPSTSWTAEAVADWTRRLGEYKTLIYQRYAPHKNQALETKGSTQQECTARIVSQDAKFTKPREAVDSGIDMEIPGKERSLNPMAKEFQPPQKPTSSPVELKLGMPKIQQLAAPPKLDPPMGPRAVSGSKGTQPTVLPYPSVSLPLPPPAPVRPGDSITSPTHASLAGLLSQVCGSLPSLPFGPLCSSSSLPIMRPNAPGIDNAGSSLAEGRGLTYSRTPHCCHHASLGCPWVRCADLRPSPPMAPVNRATLTAPAPLISSAGPVARNIPHILPPALSQIPPGPVPKPRFPNARAQQAYEEWIEWRKANEPGYALECKARQARRSHRGRGASKAAASNA